MAAINPVRVFLKSYALIEYDSHFKGLLPSPMAGIFLRRKQAILNQ